MKWYSQICLSLLLLTLATGVRAGNLGYSKEHPLLMGIDRDYPPLEFVDENGKPSGLDIRFTEELLKRLDIPYTYSPNSWEKISDDVLNGKVDLAMMVYSTYRKNITNYSRQVFRLYYQIVYRAGEEKHQRFDIRDLGGKSIAYMSSRPITDTLTSVGAVLNVVTDLQKAFIALSKGKYDAVICFRYQTKYIIEHNKLKGLRAEDMTLTPREYCYVSKSKELIEAINAELDKMDAEGIITGIYGDEVTSQFGGIHIPEWVWYAIAAMIVVFLLAFIIAQGRYQKRLRKEMERAQRSEHLKTVFLGNVSHALRTPLNSIIGFSELMSNTPDDSLSQEERQQMLKLINDNGQQLLYFIDELLQLSNIEANDLTYNRIDVNLSEIMERLAARTRKKTAPGVEVKVEGKGGCVYVDPNMMELVTMHCLDNAAKHTHSGTITLSYTIEDNGVRIAVKDTGEGLPPSLRNNIFALLTEKNTYVQDEVPGLGLSICKAIVDRSGGRIGAESPPEGGTVLWHWVPAKIIRREG